MTIDVIIDDDTLTVIHFHGKAVNPILINQHFQYFEFKLLEFSISVRCLTQSNDFCVLTYCKFLDSAGYFINSIDFSLSLYFRFLYQIKIQRCQPKYQYQKQHCYGFANLLQNSHLLYLVSLVYNLHSI